MLCVAPGKQLANIKKVPPPPFPLPLPDSLVYNVYKVVHTPHHPPPHGYDIDLYNPPPHHIKAVQPTTSSHRVVQRPAMWTCWSVCELVIRPSL